MNYNEILIKLDRIEKMLLTLLSEEQREIFIDEKIKEIKSQIEIDKARLEMMNKNEN